MIGTRHWPSAIGARQSLGSVAWLLLTPVSMVAAPFAAGGDVSDPAQLARWLLLGLVAQLPLGLVLLIGSRLVRGAVSAGPLVVIVTLAAGAARGYTIALLGPTPDVLTRVVASAITMAIWLLVIGAALQSHDHYRQEVDDLLSRLVARELQGRLLDVDATDAARAISADRINATSDELRAIVAGAADDHARTAALLQSAIENRLRPLSHDLWFSPNPVAPQAQRRGALIRRIATARVPVLALFVAALVLLGWGSYVLHGVWQGLIVGAVIALLYAGVLATANQMQCWPWASAIVRYLGVAIVPAAAGSVIISIDGLGYRLSPLAVTLGLPLITVAVAAAGTLRADQADVIADLRARLAEPDWDRHLGELVRRQVDANAATMLHNSVQPALTAAALQLRLAAALDEPERARAALERAERALDQAEGALTEGPSGRERLLRVPEAWSGIAVITLRFGALDLAPQEWVLLADVIEESTANAVRHGHAKNIVIDLAVDPEHLEISMLDDGELVRATNTPGLGRSWLATVLDSAETLTQSDGRVVSRLVVARAISSETIG